MASVEIYTRRFCSYCHYAKELLTRKGVAFREIDVTGNAEMRRQMTERAHGRSTFPRSSSARSISAAATNFTRSRMRASSIRC